MEKPRLINFIAKVMENSGFKVYKNFKTSQYTIDIYAVLPTSFGDFGVVVECNNYDKDFPVSIETLKHMEKVGVAIKASKVVVVTSSYFTEQAMNYALKKNIKLVDRTDLLGLAKKYQDDNFRLDREDFHDMGYYGDMVPVMAGGDDSYEYDDYDDYDDYDYDYEYDDYEDYNYDYSYDDYGDSYDYDTYMYNERSNNPVIYQNSLYRREFDEESRPSLLSALKEQLNNYMGGSSGTSSYSSSSSSHSLYKQGSNLPVPTRQSTYSYSNYSTSIGSTEELLRTIAPYLGNPIILIILVVIMTYLLSFIGGSLLKIDHVVISILQIVFALALSYGCSYIFGERSQAFIIRGTVVFFVSLILLIILILF